MKPLEFIKALFSTPKEVPWCLHHWGAGCPNRTTNWGGYCDSCINDWGPGI